MTFDPKRGAGGVEVDGFVRLAASPQVFGYLGGGSEVDVSNSSMRALVSVSDRFSKTGVITTSLTGVIIGLSDGAGEVLMVGIALSSSCKILLSCVKTEAEEDSLEIVDFSFL